MNLARVSPRNIKAIALLSGGLDSTLAAALIKGTGIEVIGLTVRILFNAGRSRSQQIEAVADALGIPLRTLDLSEEHLDVVRHPRHGYGAGMNPCIDCRTFMLKAAKLVMEDEGAQFVVTGEVLGQRPMSQHYQALMQAAEESGLSDRLLRPLSANLLPDTLPVKEGWIKQEDLLAIRGRGRQEQMALAKKFGIRDYPSPAGGCLLVEKAYSARLRDAFSHIGRDVMKKADFLLLRYGRHFRLSDRTKVIVGRNEKENAALLELSSAHVRIEPVEVMGPLSLIEGSPSDDELHLAAALTARYCDHDDERPITLRVTRSGEEETIAIAPLLADDPRIPSWRI
jgi:tRNA U34 2-thiouridine synthase MnmA/TrmU